MTWHLKDRELEEKLIAIDCEFLDNLNDAVKEKIEEFSSDFIEEGDLITLMFCRDHQIELGKLYFLFHELEEVPEYNPHAWNEYPKVKPVEPGIYRLEVKRNVAGVTRCYAAVFGFSGNKNWYIYGQCCLIDTNVSDGGYVRYRPWSED